LKSTSKYTGVYYNSKSKKWVCAIIIDKKNCNLGSFKNEQKARKISEIAYNNLELYNGSHKVFKNKIRCIYNETSLDKLKPTRPYIRSYKKRKRRKNHGYLLSKKARKAI